MKTRLVFGAGYLGSRLVQHWLSEGDQITVVTRSVDSAREWQEQRAGTVIANVADPDTVQAAFQHIPTHWSTVLYSIGYDRTSGEDREAVSVEGPAAVAQILRGRFDHWIFTSSTSVYGQTDGEWVDEQSPTEPPTENGARCVRAEQAITEAVGEDKLLIARLAGIYGPGRTLARKESLFNQTPLPGDGQQWLNLIHVDDAASTIDRAAASGHTGTLLVADNEPVQRCDYYGELARRYGTPPPQFDNEPRTSRGASNKRCRNAKLHTTLSFDLQYPTYREGLKHIFGD